MVEWVLNWGTFDFRIFFLMCIPFIFPNYFQKYIRSFWKNLKIWARSSNRVDANFLFLYIELSDSSRYFSPEGLAVWCLSLAWSSKVGGKALSINDVTREGEGGSSTVWHTVTGPYRLSGTDCDKVWQGGGVKFLLNLRDVIYGQRLKRCQAHVDYQGWIWSKIWEGGRNTNIWSKFFFRAPSAPQKGLCMLSCRTSIRSITSRSFSALNIGLTFSTIGNCKPLKEHKYKF